jgi:hypothetical protein
VAACQRVVLARCHEVRLSGYHEGSCGYMLWGLLWQSSMGIIVAECKEGSLAGL